MSGMRGPKNIIRKDDLVGTNQSIKNWEKFEILLDWRNGALDISHPKSEIALLASRIDLRKEDRKFDKLNSESKDSIVYHRGWEARRTGLQSLVELASGRQDASQETESWSLERAVIINKDVWKNSPENSLQSASIDRDYIHHYQSVITRFHEYMSSKDGWFTETLKRWPSAYCYFSAEYGLHHSLPFMPEGWVLGWRSYQGVQRFGCALVAVGFMYPEGYLRKDSWRWMAGEYGWGSGQGSARSQGSGLDGKQLVIKVPFIEPGFRSSVEVAVGRISLYLLDTGHR